MSLRNHPDNPFPLSGGEAISEIEIMAKDEYFDNLETMSVPERENYLDSKLRKTVRNAYLHAPAARYILDKAGIKPGAIKHIKDLEKLPITRKNDLIERQKLYPPYGGFLAIPPEGVERVFLSPGPIYEPIQHSRIKWFAKSLWAAGFRKGDIAVNTFTYHMSPAGILLHEALTHCGTTVVVTGTGNTDTQVQAMRDLKVTGFVGTPSFLMTVIKRAEELGLSIGRDLPLRLAWFTGEMLAPSVRKVLEENYHISTSQAYAVTEPGGAIAYECREKHGMHMMDEYVVEIVDPETGKQLGPGEVGEIVVTPVHNRTWGLLRFGTGDMSSYFTEPCPCGRTAYRITGIVGRTTDAVKVRGMFVVTRQAETAINSLGAVSRFQIIIGRYENRDDLTLKIELKDRSTDKTGLADDLAIKFQDNCRVKPDRIEFVDTGILADNQPKVVDTRRWE
jgi:phenylacetate-CoA ligase